MSVSVLLWFFGFKHVLTMVYFSNKCISIFLYAALTASYMRQPNVPNASGVELLWDRKLPPRVALLIFWKVGIGTFLEERHLQYELLWNKF